MLKKFEWLITEQLVHMGSSRVQVSLSSLQVLGPSCFSVEIVHLVMIWNTWVLELFSLDLPN